MKRDKYVHIENPARIPPEEKGSMGNCSHNSPKHIIKTAKKLIFCDCNTENSTSPSTSFKRVRSLITATASLIAASATSS